MSFFRNKDIHFLVKLFILSLIATRISRTSPRCHWLFPGVVELYCDKSRFNKRENSETPQSGHIYIGRERTLLVAVY